MIESDLQNVLERLAALEERIDQPPARWLTVRKAASYCSVSETTIRRLLKRKAITPRRPAAGVILLDRKELDQYIIRATRTPRTSRGSATRTRRSREFVGATNADP